MVAGCNSVVEDSNVVMAWETGCKALVGNTGNKDACPRAIHVVPAADSESSEAAMFNRHMQPNISLPMQVSCSIQ